MSVYLSVMETLLKACSDYRERALSLDAFKSIIWNSAQQIVSVEEKELRLFLQKSEGRLDIIQFTVNEKDIFPRTLIIIDEIENRIKKEL